MFKRISIFHGLLLLNLAVLVMAFLASCGSNSTVNPTSSNVQLQVLNLSPDSYPVELYVKNVRVNTAYRYNTTPTYFYLPNTDTPLQVRSTRVNDDVLIFSSYNKGFLPNTRYSLFFTGLYSEKTLQTVITEDDTELLPEVGKGGKIRFVNASPRSDGFDIWANGVPVIKNTEFAKVSSYITLTPGNYTFRVYPANTSVSSLAEATNVTIQDGRLYTLYSRGIVGRIDSASFGLGVLANNPPKI